VDFGSDADVSEVRTASKNSPHPSGTKCQSRSQYKLYINRVQFTFVTIIGDEAVSALHIYVLNEKKKQFIIWIT
jgi:hypothetical protein